MGAGGVLLPPATYWEKIQAVLRKYDVMLIADEVICGFGRTGNMWGTTTYGMKPDMITCAKALSSGYLPIGAVMVSEEIYGALVKQSEKIGVFSHGFTYSGHPVTSAVALETLKIYEERDMLSHVRQMAPRMQAGLRRFADHPLVGEVRGIGLIGAIELVADKATKAPFDPDRRRVGPFLCKRAHHHGVISARPGRLHRVLPAADHQRSGNRFDVRAVRACARRHVRDGSRARPDAGKYAGSRTGEINQSSSEGRWSVDPQDQRFGLPRVRPAMLCLAREIKAVAGSQLEFLAGQFDVQPSPHQI